MRFLQERAGGAVHSSAHTCLHTHLQEEETFTDGSHVAQHNKSTSNREGPSEGHGARCHVSVLNMLCKRCVCMTSM